MRITKRSRDCKQSLLRFTTNIGVPRCNIDCRSKCSSMILAKLAFRRRGDQFDRSPAMISLISTRDCLTNYNAKIAQISLVEKLQNSELTWKSTSINPKNNKNLNQCVLGLWSKFGDFSFNKWQIMVRTSSKWGKLGLLSEMWPWVSRSIAPKNNRDLTQGILHLWSKFGDPNHSRMCCAQNTLTQLNSTVNLY